MRSSGLLHSIEIDVFDPYYLLSASRGSQVPGAPRAVATLRSATAGFAIRCDKPKLIAPLPIFYRTTAVSYFTLEYTTFVSERCTMSSERMYRSIHSSYFGKLLKWAITTKSASPETV